MPRSPARRSKAFSMAGRVYFALLMAALLLGAHASAPPRGSHGPRRRHLANTATTATRADPNQVYEYCTNGQDSVSVLQCVTDSLEQHQLDSAYDVHAWLLIFASALIFFMQAGFAMLCAGSVRLKNVGNTMLKNLLDACGAALGFFSVGFAFAFGGQNETTATTFIGTTNFFMVGTCTELTGGCRRWFGLQFPIPNAFRFPVSSLRTSLLLVAY